MSRNIRILTKPNDGDKYVKVKLEHSFDFLEILSLRLTQADVYRKFAADYGVIVGRVVANGGFGIPNAKVSVFIPLDENETNPLIKELYPYQTTKDTNFDGVRYNLLEDLPQRPCHVSVGTFPNKRKVLDNDVWLEIYDKYYKFTTSTNFAGDFMIFGVPVGNQNLHMDVDYSNMDYVSLKPYDLIEQGYTETLFESSTTFKTGTDLGSLVQIQSNDYAVNVLPFWGDLEENEVGINRVDFNLNTEIIPNATFFGSMFTDSKKASVRKKCQPRKTIGKNCDLNTGVGTIEMIRRVSETSNEVEYMQIESKQIDENGNWAFTVPMNLNKVITDEFGNLIASGNPDEGIATKAKVRFRMALDEQKDAIKFRTAHYLIPNMYNNYQFGNDTQDFDFFEMRWKKTYTVTNYIPRYQKATGSATRLHTGIKDIGECENTQSFPFNRLNLNPTFLFTILCIVISFFALVIKFINSLLRFIIFGVVLKFVCFLKHWRNRAKRGACRCNACFNLESGLQDPQIPTFPNDWTDTTPCTVCINCAVCYDASDDDTTSSSSFAFKPTILLPPLIGITVDGGGLLTPSQTVTVGFGDFSSISGSVTDNNYQFILQTDGSGYLSKVLLINQSGLGTDPTTYNTNYTLTLTPASYGNGGFWGAATSVEFTLTPRDIIILSDPNDATLGTYNTINDTIYTYGLGNGGGVVFDEVIINGDGQLDSIEIYVGNEGSLYTPYIDFFPTLEKFTIPLATLGASSDKIFGFSIDAFQTTTVVDGVTVDCSTFDISTCEGECDTCPVSLIDLECAANNVVYDDVDDWADCVKENLAENLGIVKFDFYNDWVIGSLYSRLFDYKSKFKKKGKSLERYCDYNCRAPNVDVPTFCPTSPPEKDPNYKRRRNRCHDAYIAESYIFNAPEPRSPCFESTIYWDLEQIEAPNSTLNGRGLIIEYDGFLYYSARHDVEINFVDDINRATYNLTVADKTKLLFATNLIELGSMVTCDRDGEPFVVNSLESTTYQKDDGIGVLYDYSDCFSSCPINRYGTQLMSQAGIEIAFAQAGGTAPSLIGDDGEDYLLFGSDSAVPDYDENNGIIIFDRTDIVLRRLLCENFNYYNVSGTHASAEVPTDSPLTAPLAPPPTYPFETNPAYVEEVSPDTDPNDILEFTIDSCAGFDDAVKPSEKMPPYYMYFGIRQGQSSLDKLRKNYFDRCVDIN